ncbi:MAG: thiolase family protein [Deltaproteobacteria bacterium]|nr:thiolase family protein [Deltaproteobacteria bacterium]
MFSKAFIPYKGYYSTPFSRWQGSFANENSILLGGETSKRWLVEKGWDPKIINYVILGITVGQKHQFFSATWAGALMGAGTVPGVTLSQACTTGTTSIYQACCGVETDSYKTCYVLMADRTSNGPHTIWPNPKGPGGMVDSENWLMDNFNSDPNVGLKMVETAENVAKEGGFTKEDCDALTLRRYEQYLMALENDRDFQKGYMFPPEIKISKKKTILIQEDEGITECTRDGLAALKPVIPDGTLSFGAQTHPADANAAVVVTTEERAKELSADPSVSIQVISYGYSRERKGYMAAAPVPATRMALEKAGLKIGDMKAIKTHNPFVVNDLYLAKEMGIDPNGFNNYGCSLIYGHPQGPTAGRLIIEGLEETVKLGGGYFLWTGCAAGDTGGAMVFKVVCR